MKIRTRNFSIYKKTIEFNLSSLKNNITKKTQESNSLIKDSKKSKRNLTVLRKISLQNFKI